MDAERKDRNIYTTDGQSIIIQFAYDPMLVSAVKATIPLVTFNRQVKCWACSPGMYREIRTFAGKHAFHVTLPARTLLDQAEASQKESRATETDVEIPVPAGQVYLPYQAAGIVLAAKRKHVLLGDQMGLGKLLPDSEPVLTPHGWVLNGELRVGDYAIGRDGKPTEIVGVFPQGEQEIVRVTFSDGSWARCSRDHLWAVQHVRNDARDKWRVMTVTEIVRRGLKDASGNRNWRIPMVEPIEYNSVKLPIEPYLLGVILGDGSTVRSVRLTTDMEIVQSLGLPGRHFKHKSDGITEFSIADQGLKIELRNLGLFGKRAWEKFVPAPYLRGEPIQRLSLLQGLMDTDGYAMPDGGAEFSSTSSLLVDAVVELVQSLGGIARGRRPTASTYSYKDEIRKGRPAERVNVKLPAPWNLFRLKRKASTYQVPTKYQPMRAIESVEPDGREMATCIKVAAEYQLYVTRSFIVTHNTIQAIGVMNMVPEIEKALIITPASLKLNWYRELCKWLVRKRVVAVADADWFPPADVLILNYDILHKYEDRIRSIKWDYLVCDEAHYLKNPETRRSVMVFGNLNSKKRKTIDRDVTPIQAEWKAFLTGTPIVNRPMELWGLIHALDPVSFPNKWKYYGRYCGGTQTKFGYQYQGASNLEELQERLRSTVMIRRLKKDVLTDLPPKRRQVIEFSAGSAEGAVQAEVAAYQRYQEILAELRVSVELAKASDVPEEYDRSVHALRQGVTAAFTEMAKLRKETAIAKVPHVIAHLHDVLDDGDEKIVLFGHHHAVIEAFAKEFGKSCVVLTGKTEMEDRQAAVDRFQRDPSCKLFIGGIQAAGVGLTLTAASHVIFAELDWVPGNISQAEDRLHRIGQRNAVLVQHLVLESSLDATMAKKLILKQEIIDRALDLDTSARELADAPAIADGEPDSHATDGVSKRKIEEEAAKLQPEQIAAIHEALKMLAGLCDGARKMDGVGFNKIDARIGKSLAQAPRLTPKQAALGKKIAMKYKRQLPESIVEAMDERDGVMV